MPDRLKMKEDATKAAKKLLAAAAILMTDPAAIKWPEGYLDDQSKLLVNKVLDAHACDSTCVAETRYEALTAALDER